MVASDYRRESVERYASTHAAHFAVRDAAWYEERARFFHHRLAGFLPPDPDAPILDAACGAGELLHYLRARGYANAWGIDLSLEQLEHARKMGIQNVSQADLLAHLAASPSSYELIVASHVLEHLPKPEVLECLRRMASAVRPGGRIIVLTPNAGSPLGLPYSLGDFTHEVYFTAMSLAQAAALAGLGIVHLGGIRPDPGARRGRLKRAAWDLVLGPVLRGLLGDKRMHHGLVMEPELIGVFCAPASRDGAAPGAAQGG